MNPLLNRWMVSGFLCLLTACTVESPLTLIQPIPSVGQGLPIISCPQIKTCFVPCEDCASQIIQQLTKAQQSILVQAYSFTSKPISGALVAAHQRGVKVPVLLDKIQLTERYSAHSWQSH